MEKKNGTSLSLSKGFTLVEVLIVVAIMTLFVISGISTYVNTLKASRDTKRKADLGTIQKGLESYYNDNGYYPADLTTGTPLCASDTNCYLKTIPLDPSGYVYLYVRGDVSGTSQSFQLYSVLERNNDAGTGNDDTGTGTGTYSSNCGAVCRYGVSSTNTTP